MAEFCQFDLCEYIFGMINFYEATPLCGLSEFNHQGLKLQEIFIFITSGLPPQNSFLTVSIDNEKKMFLSISLGMQDQGT